jgi:hypothetical protein
MTDLIVIIIVKIIVFFLSMFGIAFIFFCVSFYALFKTKDKHEARVIFFINFMSFLVMLLLSGVIGDVLTILVMFSLVIYVYIFFIYFF